MARVESISIRPERTAKRVLGYSTETSLCGAKAAQRERRWAVSVRCRPLPLTELHAQLHRHGFGIAHRHPVKALADALGYETEQGNTRRVSRGVYALTPGTVPRNHTWLLDDTDPTMPPTPAFN